MALQKIELNPGTGGAQVGVDVIGTSSYQVVKSAYGAEGDLHVVSASSPLPVSDSLAQAALSSIAAEDFATQTTLAAVLAKLIASPASEQTLQAIATLLGNQQTNALTNTELRATPVPVSVSGTSTAARQDTQTDILTALNTLVQTNNLLVDFLRPLAAAMNSGQPALRVVQAIAPPAPGGTTTVAGSVTATVASTVVSSITNFGTGIPAKEMADDFNNLVVTMANINKVTL